MIYSKIERAEIISWLREVLCIQPANGDAYNTSIDDLNLSVRASNILTNAGIQTISDFMLFNHDKLFRMKNVGEKTIYEIGNVIREVLTTPRGEDNEETSINRQNGECDSSIDYYLTFEEEAQNNFDEKLLNTPIEELNLSVRAFNGLKDAGLKTIKDVVDFGFNVLRGKKNIGEKTITDIKNAILEVKKTKSDKISEISFVDAINSIISSVIPKYLPIIEARFGYNWKCMTLEEIGSNIGITRERVRQIIVKENRRIKHPKRKKSLQAIIENIERLLFKYKGILSINDIAKDSYFIGGTYKHIGFLTNLIIELYENRYRIIDKYFLTSLTDNEIKALRSKIRDAALESKFPIDAKLFIKNTMSSVGLLSTDYLFHHLLYRERIKISDGKVLSLGRFSIPKRIRLIMKDINKPLHFSEIAEFYRKHFNGKNIKTSGIERTIHTRIGDSKDFVIVGPGTFLLRSKFELPVNIDTIVKESREILRGLSNISDTKFLVKELKQRGVDIGALNAYSLKPVLLEHAGFVAYRKFEIGLEEYIDKYERKSLNDMLFELLLSVRKPLHIKTIWKEISKQRGFPKYAVDQKLADDPRFIRVAPATYALAKNIPQYEEKKRHIIDFAKKWINFKKNPISVFFISEVLKETEEIKDLPLGLVEHVLATCPDFIRLSNGFYDLVEK